MPLVKKPAINSKVVLNQQQSVRPFHLAIPTHSVPKCREFYGGILGCQQGRYDGDRWQDWNFFGHQLVTHFTSKRYRARDYFNPVDAENVPVPHFGLCLRVPEFHDLVKRLEPYRGKEIKYIVEPYLRFEGMPGAQFTMFFKDPSGNNLEFKAMVREENLFAKYDVAAAAEPKKKAKVRSASSSSSRKKQNRKKKKIKSFYPCTKFCVSHF